MEKDELSASQYFQTNIYTIEKPEWVSDIDKACDIHIERAKSFQASELKRRKEVWGEELYIKKATLVSYIILIHDYYKIQN